MFLRYLFALLIAASVAAKATAAITYHVQPREGDKDGWALLGGSITTDGTLGEITPANFVAWKLEMKSPAGRSEISSDDGAAILYETIFTFGSCGGGGWVPGAGSPETTCGDVRSIAPMEATRDSLLLGYPQPSTSPTPLAFNNAIKIANLIFADEDPFAAEFDGKLVSFIPGLPSQVTWTSSSRSFGNLIDNAVEPSLPTGLRYDGASNPNTSVFEIPGGRLLLARTYPTPEPATAWLAIAAAVLAVAIRLAPHAALNT